MTRTALVALLARDGPLPPDAADRFARQAQAHGLDFQTMDGGTLVATGGAAAASARAATAGEIFARHSHFPRDPAEFASAQPAKDGQSIDRSWGSFLHLEVGTSPAPTTLTRSAFGDLPCYWMADGTCLLVATSPALLADFARRPPRVDWTALARYLRSPEMRTPETCLAGVQELPGGCTLVVGAGETGLRRDWSPWPFVACQEPDLDLDSAASRVGSAIDRAVAARCRPLGRPVLLLSGGIDSSTLAAALRQGAIPFPALTMVTRQKSGDERCYARAVAEMTGAVLTEQMRELAVLDWTDRTPRRHARPSLRLFRQATFAAARQLALMHGADTIVDGAGGDNLFCSLQSVVPLLDRYAAEGPGKGVWRTARDIALRAELPIARVFAAAVRRHRSGRIAYNWSCDPSFLAPDHRTPDETVSHPWLAPPPGTLPGQAAHVALVLGALHLGEDASTDPGTRTISPLIAQPIVEAVLQVPSWLWFGDGRNRMVVRRAYSERLPPAVLSRTGKGTPAGFMTEIVAAHRERLRALLLDGVLVAEGLADRSAIEQALAASPLDRDNGFDRLLVIADAERWARLWL